MVGFFICFFFFLISKTRKYGSLVSLNSSVLVVVWGSSAVGSHHGVASYLRVSGAATSLSVSAQGPGRCALLVPSGLGSQRAGPLEEKATHTFCAGGVLIPGLKSN